MENMQSLMGEIKNRRLEEAKRQKAAADAPKVVSEAVTREKMKVAVIDLKNAVKEVKATKWKDSEFAAILKKLEKDAEELENWFFETFGEPWEQ